MNEINNVDFPCLGIDARIEVRRWETDVPPGLHTDGPQGVVEPALDIPNSDGLIVIVWNRLGTPTPSGETGTEREVRIAFEAWQKTRRPEILFYFRVAPSLTSNVQDAEQARRALAFRDYWKQNGLVAQYSDRRDFERQVRQDLKQRFFPQFKRVADSAAASYSVATSRSVVRAEGLTELLGDCEIVLRNPGALRTADIHVIHTVNVTNRVNSEDMTDAVLRVLSSDERAETAGVLVGRLVGGNTLLFSQVPISDDRVSRFRVSNVRGAISGSSAPSGMIIANVDVVASDYTPLFVESSGGVVATVRTGLDFRVRSSRKGNWPVVYLAEQGVNCRFLETGSASALEIDLLLKFKERWPGLFKNAAREARSARSVAGVTGTRLRAVFDDVPPNVRLLVSTHNISLDAERPTGTATPAAMLMAADTFGSGEFAPVQPLGLLASGVPVAEVPVNQGSATAVWEWVGEERPHQFAEVTFGLIVCCRPGGASPTAKPAMVNGTLGPISSVSTASRSAPIPRFTETGSATAIFEFR